MNILRVQLRTLQPVVFGFKNNGFTDGTHGRIPFNFSGSLPRLGITLGTDELLSGYCNHKLPYRDIPPWRTGSSMAMRWV